jgi:cyclophilin family peptidyl-prolyl cis-trans isomerase
VGRGTPRTALAGIGLVLLVGAGCERSSPPATRLDLSPPAPEQVLTGLEPLASIPVQLLTDAGVVHCTLDAQRAPHAVASFVGLATGRSPHRDARDGSLSDGPLYENLHFFRGVPGMFVQAGCQRDDGTGHPGYRFAPEPQPEDASRLGRGALFLAAYTPPPNRVDPAPPPAGHTLGSQFVIALTSMRHLAGRTTVLGRCDDLDVVERLARARQAGRLPLLERVLVGAESPR